MRLKTLLKNMIVAAGVLAMSTPGYAATSAQESSQESEAAVEPQHSRTRPPKKKKAEASQTKPERKQDASKDKTPAKATAKGGKKSNKSQAPAVSERYRAFKVNVPYAAFAVQNLAFEWQTGRKMTIDIPVMWSFSDLTDRHGIRTVALQPEARWWPGANPGSGHFLGAHASVAWFNVRWNDTRYQADTLPLLGAGISYGYRLNFTQNWGAEFNLGAGYAYMKYDRFYNIDNGAKINRKSRNYFGITRVGISLVYRF